MRKTIKSQAEPEREDKIEFIFSTKTKDDIDQYIKSPIENAREALENLKSALSVGIEEDVHLKYIRDITKAAESFEVVDHMPKSFIWHRITSITPLADVSCFAHILHNQGAVSVFAKHGYYLLGIRDNIICFALPVCENEPNPIKHIDDCIVYIEANGAQYCTVCVSLEPDGQYFMGIC